MKTIAILLTVFLLFGCITSPTAPIKTMANTTNNSTGVKMTNPTVVFETTKGTFKAEIYKKEAPITAANFIGLVESKFYDGLTFHRYEPGFVVQGGDPKGDGSGGSGKRIQLEVSKDLKHEIGSLSMARTNDPNSATSQFFIVIGEASFLDMQYAVFGKVTEGKDISMNLRKGDKMNKVYVQK